MDEEGKTIKNKDEDELKNDEGVVVVESRAQLAADTGDVASANGSASTTDKKSSPLAENPGNPKRRKRSTAICKNPWQNENPSLTSARKERDKVTLGKIVGVADTVATAAFKKRDIALDIPLRTRSNTNWNKRGI